MADTMKNHLLEVMREQELRRRKAEEEVRKASEIISGAEALLRNLYDVIPSVTTTPSETDGQYDSMSIPDIAAVILAESKRGMSADELAVAMIAKGKTFRSKKPRDSIQALLNRHPDTFKYRARRWNLKQSDREAKEETSPGG